MYVLLYKIKNQTSKSKKTDKQISKEISVGFYLGVSNIIIFILVLLSDKYLL